MNKYSDDVRLNLFGDTLNLEYLHLINNEKDCYQLINVQEFEDKLRIEFLTQYITKIIDIDELEDIFEMLHRQSTHKPLSKEEIQFIKDKYITGKKIKLIKMYDLQALPAGTIGIVDFVDDLGQIQMIWENGSTLALNIGIDEFEVI